MDVSKTNPAPLPPDEELTEVRKPASLLIAQFFLFPLIIIGICVGIFLFFGYMTYRPGNISEYLDEVRFGAGTQRWQAAYELSTRVKSNPQQAQSPEFLESLMTAYKSSPDEDITVRPQELAMAASLIESMSADFKPEEFTDDYRAALQQVIDAKVSGKEIVAAPEIEEAPSGAIDLMAALRASVERAKAARESGAAPAEHEPVQPTPIHSARSAKKTAPAKAAKETPAKKAAPAKKTAAAEKKAPAKKAAPAKATKETAAKKATAKKAPAKARKSA